MPHTGELAITEQLKSIIRDWNLAEAESSRVTVIANPTHVGYLRRMRISWRNAVARYEAETGHSPDAGLMAEVPPGLMSPE